MGGLSMAERQTVTKQMAKRYEKASKARKGTLLDELCALTGWTRRHARRALRDALRVPAPAARWPSASAVPGRLPAVLESPHEGEEAKRELRDTALLRWLRPGRGGPIRLGRCQMTRAT